MTGPVVPDSLIARARRWRHDLHRIPETAFSEHETRPYVARVLRELGYDVAVGIGGTGLVASLTRGTSGRTVGLRSELDALPITEESGVDYVSGNPGAMHACGHDGHMAMLLGAAALLAEEGGFDGTLHAIFQPCAPRSSCTDLRTDGARNAIPTHVTITGDTRSFDTEVQELLERRIREVSQGVAAVHGASVEVTYTHEFAPTINDAGCVNIAGRAAD